MSELFIQIENTPNPLTRKFVLGFDVTDAPYEVASLDTVPDVLRPLFSIGVASIFVGRDYLSLTIEDAVLWPDLQADARQVITNSAEALKTLSRSEATDVTDDPVVERIKGLLDTHIRPAVAHDGGDVRYHSFDDKGILHLEMSGACSGCPSSTATLKLGIRNMMRHFVPEVLDVEAVAR
ncbi:NifU family protein [Agrobacterium salinitolerans]|nr:NifU family protein [Agrobacterium salinitolerans]